MIRLNHVLSAGALLFASVAAHAVDVTHTFESISSVQHTMAGTVLVGILANDTVPSSLAVPNDNSVGRCAKYYDTMLENQGIYTLSVTIRTLVSAGTTIVSLEGCQMELKP
jgi:hypothetical protein